MSEHIHHWNVEPDRKGVRWLRGECECGAVRQFKRTLSQSYQLSNAAYSAAASIQTRYGFIGKTYRHSSPGRNINWAVDKG